MSGEEYQASLSILEVALRDALKAYVQWHVGNWKMTKEQWLREFANDPPKGDYFDGYTAGVESAVDSLDMFLDEFHG